MKAPDDRWYKGKRHCVAISPVSSMKTVKVQWDDGTQDIVPVRMCWRWKKEEPLTKIKLKSSKIPDGGNFDIIYDLRDAKV